MVLMSEAGLTLQTRRHDEVFTATETDVLRDTDIRQAPGPGALGFWLASDQNDTTVTIRVGGRSLANQTAIPNRGTNAPIQENQEMPIAMVMVNGGELVQIDLTEVTAATFRLTAVWIGIGG